MAKIFSICCLVNVQELMHRKEPKQRFFLTEKLVNMHHSCVCGNFLLFKLFLKQKHFLADKSSLVEHMVYLLYRGLELLWLSSRAKSLGYRLFTLCRMCVGLKHTGSAAPVCFHLSNPDLSSSQANTLRSWPNATVSAEKNRPQCGKATF